jgi:hypothetical protein
VIADNLIKSKVRIKNNGSRQFQIHDNAADESQPGNLNSMESTERI